MFELRDSQISKVCWLKLKKGTVGLYYSHKYVKSMCCLPGPFQRHKKKDKNPTGRGVSSAGEKRAD